MEAENGRAREEGQGGGRGQGGGSRRLGRQKTSKSWALRKGAPFFFGGGGGQMGPGLNSSWKSKYNPQKKKELSQQIPTSQPVLK